jgi:hypothetical protein
MGAEAVAGAIGAQTPTASNGMDIHMTQNRNKRDKPRIVTK